jgi:hypothetical protein
MRLGLENTNVPALLYKIGKDKEFLLHIRHCGAKALMRTTISSDNLEPI